jgi:general secretion pathway protein H
MTRLAFFVGVAPRVLRPAPDKSRAARRLPHTLASRAPSARRKAWDTRRRPAHGFTLLEILVVVVIIGVIVAAATLSVGVLGADRQVEDGTRRFWAVLQQAREEAELQGQEIGVYITANAYEFLRFDARRDAWTPIEYDEFYRARELPDGLRYRVWLDGREAILKLQPPDRSDEEESKKQPPQIMVLSSGEIMPFELRIERDGMEALWRVVGLPDNDLRVERRESQRDWALVAQTREPEDEDERERVSSTRR